MANTKKIAAKAKAKRAGIKALRADRPANTYQRKDGKTAPALRVSIDDVFSNPTGWLK